MADRGRPMDSKPIFLLLVIAILALLASNSGFRKLHDRDRCEITSYEYAKLHAAMDRHAEIAHLAESELTREFVSVAQYNKIMRQVELLNLKEARHVAVMRQTASADTVVSTH